MTENEYIIISNKSKVSIAKDILRDVLPGKEFGFPKHEHQKIMKTLALIEETLFDMVETDE